MKAKAKEMNLLTPNKNRSVKAGVNAFNLLKWFKSTKRIHFAFVGVHFKVINEPMEKLLKITCLKVIKHV